MSRKKPTPSRKEPERQREMPAPVVAPAEDKVFSLILTVAYAVIAIIGLANHEMWRDEIQPWLPSSISQSLSEFFVNRRLDSNPYLWYLILYALSKITLSPVVIQVAHISFSIATIYLVSRFAPFSRWQKGLLAFGYYFLFEYALISRGYSMTLFFLVLFCWFYRRYAYNYLFLAIALLFLANSTGGFGAILSIALLGLLIANKYFARHSTKKQPEFKYFSWSVVLILVSIWFAMRSITPPPDSIFSEEWVTAWDGARVQNILSRVWNGFFPIGDFSVVEFWNTNFLVGKEISPAVLNLVTVVALIILAFNAVYFSSHLGVWAFYMAGTSGILLLSYLSGSIFYINASRYNGFLFLVYVVSYWLLHSGMYPVHPVPVLNSFREKWKLNSVGGQVLTAFLILQVMASGLALYKDFKYDFSASKDAGEYIVENNLHRYRMAGFVDYAVSPITAYTRKPFYYPERDTISTFPIWTKTNYTTDGNQVITRLVQKLSTWNDTALVVFNFDLNTSMIGDIAFIPMQSFKNSIVADENYSIYLAYKFRLEDELKDSVTELSDQRVQSLLGVSFNLLQENKLAEFERVYKRIRKKAESGNYPRFHNAAGMYLMRMNRPSEALIEFRKEIQKGGNAEESYFQTGMLYYQMQKMDSALICWEEAMKLNPKNVDALSNSAVVYFNIRKDVEKAKALWDQALMLNPRYTQLYVNLMLVCQSRNDEDCKLHYLKGALSQGMSLDDIKARGVTISDALLSRLK